LLFIKRDIDKLQDINIKGLINIVALNGFPNNPMIRIIKETKNELIKEDKIGLFLLIVEETIPPDKPPEIMLTTDKISENLIGFLNFKETEENITDNIKINAKDDITPQKTAENKLSFVLLTFIRFFSYSNIITLFSN